jgi:glutamine synthetase type III
MNPKIKFEGSINGRTYSDEKVFQYALRDAIAKGEDIEVHATSTMADAQEEPAVPQKPMYENFEIAINPDKIAANLECAQDRDEFIANLSTGLQAVVGQFTDAMKENSIDPAMACKKFEEEMNSVRSKYNNLIEKEIRSEKKVSDLEEKLEAADEEHDTIVSTMMAFNLLYQAYAHMKDLCKKNMPVLQPAAEKKECGCDERNCKPTTMNELIEQFVNLWK